MLKQSDIKPHQELSIKHLLAHDRCALWAQMGMGKTVSTLTALDIKNYSKDIYPALVLAPKRVARTTWPEEPSKWAHLSHIGVSDVTGDLDRRIAQLKQPADIYTLNYEQIPWLVGLYGEKWPFKTIIADEATRLKSHRLRQGGLRTKNLAAVAFGYTDTFWELTGTPSPNGIKDLWGQGWFLDKGERLGRTHDDFKQRWFQKSWDGYGMDPLPHAQGEIEAKLADICLSLRTEDWFDLEKPIETPVYIDLPPDARKLYRDMERDMFMRIEQEGVEAFNAAGRTNKCLQLANGAAYVGEEAKEWKVIHDEKLAALESIIEEANGAPILVAYTFRSDLKRLLKHFPQGRELDSKPKTEHDWNAGKIPLLFAHPQSAGHGLNLQHGGNILVFFGHDWNLEYYEQIIERIGPMRQHQSGYNRNVFIYHIIARNTIEEDVIERRETKATVQQSLMKAMRRIRL